MNEEIKDLIKLLNEYKIREKNGEDKFYPEDIIIIDELWQLLDYITNLQEENQKLNNKTKRLNSKIKVLEHNCKQAEDSCRQHRLANKNKKRRLQRREEQINLYKTRIDKAIEILEKQMPVCIMPNNTLIHGTEKAKVLEDLLNILQGSDE